MLLPLLLINSAFADVTSDARIQAYKANKLIPQNAVLPTSSNTTNSSEICIFSSDSLSWTRMSKGMYNEMSKYAGWTIEDFRNAYQMEYGSPYAPIDDAMDMAGYLSKVMNGDFTSDVTPEEASTLMNELYNYYIVQSGGPYAFPMEGIDVSKFSYNFAPNMSQCIGMTPEQAMYFMNGYYNCNLPEVKFTGNENFNGKNIMYQDLSNIKGLTGEQIAQCKQIYETVLPAIAFNGSEDLSNTSFQYTDLTKCTGITAQQISDAFNAQTAFGTSLQYAKITQAQYDAWKDVIAEKMGGKGEAIYIDGVYTNIP